MRRLALAFLPASLLTACGEHGILEPTGPGAIAGTTVRAGIVVTPDYSAFDARTDFSNAGTVDHLNGFEEFTGDLLYPQPTPWTSGGVTYTSALNVVLSPVFGLGIQSNSMATEFGQPLTATFAAGDAFTLFGADLTLIGAQAPVSVVVYTNLGSYSFPNLAVPLASSGERFFGVGLARPGEYLTGFTFSVSGGAAVLLDDVAVGHVAANGNADPVASAGGPYVGTEGSPVSLAFGGSDPDNDVLTYTWDLGDGTTGSGPTPPSSHVYADNGSFAIALTASDGNGGTHTVHATATIANVAPTLAPFTLPSVPVAFAAGGASVDISATFTDPGTADVHSTVLDCGTGGIVESPAPNGTAAGTCTFSTPGVYTVQLTVADDDGGSDTRVATGQVVVYDPAAWVTGGGWIASSEGAPLLAAVTRSIAASRSVVRTALASSGATARLTFALVARYESGASIPTGSAEVKLQFVTFDFSSTSLDWLVVAGGTARLHGRGTLNGVGDYEFDLTAGDDPLGDTIRIRIWNRITGEVAYDTHPGQSIQEASSPLAGGSIEIHPY